ncbi:hypothetical protein M3N64_01065 [Sporolactobacillus sp. CPB3-1]|uniref:Uncharacterized protein n=1 Tax=Sporolactobacillus mangiferae TaxID=2940498 RepID=A0ABT0M6Q0_9BACL|nr:hypothetical protein [Sporolactobacillus mangiferae]MCL1630542.1 hypothetical protein [Sporolactobacillus mangiferae]
MFKEIAGGIIICIWGLVAIIKPEWTMKSSPVFSHFKPNPGIKTFYRIAGVALPIFYFLGISGK